MSDTSRGPDAADAAQAASRSPDVFDDERRAQYVDALGAVVPPGGRYFMCCFSDRQPGEWGPRRVRQEEIRSAFAHGWEIESIEPVEFQTILDPPTAQAWLSTIIR